MNATTLLTAWEQGAAQHPLRRAITLLALAWPQKSPDEWTSASIGERDRRLLELRQEIFGTRLEAVATCPQCNCRLDLSFRTNDVRVAKVSTTLVDRRQVVTADYELSYRLPTSADLLRMADDPQTARELLLDACVEARRNGVAIEAARLPPSVVSLLGEAMADADPQADVQVELSCPSCSHGWSALFDIASYLWSEIEEWAERLLREVHSLASAYGWSEREIVSMSAKRRRLYLELLET